MTEREKIIRLARECNVKSLKEPRYHMDIYELTGQAIEAFYKAAHELAYEKAAQVCDEQHNRARTSTGAARANACAEAIRQLKEQS